MGNKDGILKNVSVFIDEWKSWFVDQKHNIGRFKYVTAPFQKSRVPQQEQDAGYPDNNEVTHLLWALVTSTTQHLHRNIAFFGLILMTLELTNITDFINLID